MRLRLPTWAHLAIGQRDNWTCQICQQGYIHGQRWEIDHWKPLAKGGTNHLSNLRLAHSDCNREKASA